ncbi:helix-turn-helix domain-containing protein [Pseudomonas sp.]|uniref:helix-turn-helix domain-containing protein n=1 Tax=Pseudomonas sp. TaxID=306 RepID=UPI003524A752
MNLGARLKAERERLGLNQTDFAAVAGASKHAQINWEKGAAAPNATALDAWEKLGLDVLYVVTGKRPSGLSMPGDVVREMSLSGQALRESGIALGQVVGELKAAGAMPGQALEGVAGKSNVSPARHLTTEGTAPIDPERLSRIVEMLETAARLAGRKWQVKKLVAVAAEVYNVLADEPALDEPKVERILKLVVNR